MFLHLYYPSLNILYYSRQTILFAHLLIVIPLFPSVRTLLLFRRQRSRSLFIQPSQPLVQLKGGGVGRERRDLDLTKEVEAEVQKMRLL